jgi:predicted enzyme related to lactoylglutathione lyase
MTKPISWFEIPALDLQRAIAFYKQILGTTLNDQLSLREEQFGPTHIAVFPYDRETATGGCIIHCEGYRPSLDGAVIYLNGGSSLDPVLERVVPAGGKIALPKTLLPPGMGAYAHIVDTEGNRIGIHAAG